MGAKVCGLCGVRDVREGMGASSEVPGLDDRDMEADRNILLYLQGPSSGTGGDWRAAVSERRS